MRVTDEMFGRALLAYSDKCDHARSLRAALEACLADVPEPVAIVAACDKACRYAEGRAEAAEAKLAKARAAANAWQLTADCDGYADAARLAWQECAATLKAILDEENR